MGLLDYHLNEFEIVDPFTGAKTNIGIPDEEFLEAVKKTHHEQHKEMLEWVGGEFDPEHFDVKKVIFDDPDKRRKMAFR